ncbi:putative glycosidase [Sulfurisphaera tokodaii str. 7]|uniref:Glycosidase n=2 Tax=Sulfurisphaera tokodaii TaxID=111955 RepID=Q96XA4_SULTO|nr:GH116 family glycosyl hydrolase [Sulfurisphaera tokodaii]BAB67724.1 putative glycosidase [Sulfurisphaera tokodaii str. 7]
MGITIFFMVTYTDKDKLTSGVPLGGIGAGKIEIDNRARIVNVTIANNWINPIKELKNFFIYIKPEEGEGFVLQKGLSLFPQVEQIVYEGLYPFVFLRGRRKGIEVNLTAFSSLIPHDIRNSTLPAVGFKISVNGSKRGYIAISMPNIVGSTKIGRINERVKNGVIFKNMKANDYDPAKGDITLISEEVDRVIVQYDADEIITDLDKVKDNPHEVTGLREIPASILFATYEKEVKFVFSWYFIGKHVFYPYGHYYHNFFSNSLEVAKYFLENFDYLERKTREWQDKIGFDSWLKDALINSAYILSTSTWLDEKGRFSIFEAPTNFPYQGTIGTCYEFGSLPILSFFPELDKSFLNLLTAYIREDGYVPHDLGYCSLDSPTDGTTAPPKWKDLNPTYILLIYRYYKLTGDIEFLKSVYDKVKKAFEWELKFSRYGLEGKMDSAFDVTPIKGINSYTLSLYIASLFAMREISKTAGDNLNLDEQIKEAKEAFEKMFNGKYFIAWEGMEDAVFLAQVFGEWWTTLLGLEPIADEEKIKSALRWIIKVNGNASKYCTPNLVKEDGKVVSLSPQTYSSWPRLVFAICWLSIEKGISEGLQLCEKEWQNLVSKGLVWDQPSRINSFNGLPDPVVSYLDHYIGSPSLWSFIVKKLINAEKENKEHEAMS